MKIRKTIILISFLIVMMCIKILLKNPEAIEVSNIIFPIVTSIVIAIFIFDYQFKLQKKEEKKEEKIKVYHKLRSILNNARRRENFRSTHSECEKSKADFSVDETKEIKDIFKNEGYLFPFELQTLLEEILSPPSFWEGHIDSLTLTVDLESLNELLACVNEELSKLQNQEKE